MQLIDNILSEDLFHDLRQHSRIEKLMRTNLTSWHADVIGHSGAIMVFDLKGDLAKRVKKQISPHIRKEARNQKWGMTLHLGTRMSYIPWHNDNQSLVNVTVYLNENWHRMHAGYFIYEDGEELKAVMPKRNLGLVYDTPLMHTVALSNFHAPLRESLQIFITPK